MKKIKLLFAIVFISITFSGCDPNDSNSSSQNDDTFAQNFGNSVSKDFIGQVVDTDNHPIQNAEIKIGTSTVQTDINGVFMINGAEVHERFAYITAKKSGYIDGSRSMVPTSGKNNMRIMLIPNTPLQTIQSGVDSEVALPSGTKVSFDGEFQDESGAAYSGTVSVALFHLLPSDDNIDKLMPGMLYAQTKTNEEAVLETFGMLNVELRGSAGQKLNIKEGHTAEITLKIDDSQTATAPNSIPLWHFDEEKGYWKEDGVAAKVGNKYVGEVSHFSWWNCDMPNMAVYVKMKFLDNAGNPLPNLGVKLVINATNADSYIQATDDKGEVAGFVPKNQALTLKCFGPCDSPIYTSQIGPFSTNTTLQNVSINTSVIQSTMVSGLLLKCDNTNVTNGYILINNGKSFYPVTNGQYSFRQIYCTGSSNFDIMGMDFDTMKSTQNHNYSFLPLNTNIPNLIACNTITEYVYYKFENEPTLFVYDNIQTQNLVGQPADIRLNIYANPGTGPLISLHATNTLPGIYHSPDVYWTVTQNDGPGSYSLKGFGGGSAIELNFKILKFGGVGDYIDFEFSGSARNGSPPILHITGYGHVLRDH